MRFLATADWHLRYDRPRCRTDADWIETQRRAVQFIVKKANEYNADIFHLGDIFDTPSVSTQIWNLFTAEIDKLNGKFYFIAGNHDLPYHSISLLPRASIYPLFYMNPSKYRNLVSDERYGASHFGAHLVSNPKKEMLFLHTLTFKNKKAQGLAGGTTAQELLNKFPDTRFIFTGDNHQSFVYDEDARLVINPGCILRQTADLMDYEPSVFYVDTETAQIYETIPVPDTEIVTDYYLRSAEERESRIGAFIEKVRSTEGVSFSFIENVRHVLKTEKIDKDVVDTITTLFDKAGVSL